MAHGITWYESFDILSDYARRECLLIDDVPFIDRFLKSMYNYECYKCKGEKITVGELCLKYRNGTYLITMQGHITCMIDGVEPLSLIVFASGIIVSALILAKKDNRKLPIIFAIISILSVQIIGLFVTIFIRPFYIARYCNEVLGIFALLVAFGTKNIKVKAKKVICICLSILSIGCVVVTGIFEYNPSMKNFFNRFDKVTSSSDTFIYTDSAFGIMSYYYPKNTHICTYYESWFSAFDNVQYINKKKIKSKINSSDTVWFVKNTLTKTPMYLKENYKLKSVDSFKCDFNTFQVYSVQKK